MQSRLSPVDLQKGYQYWPEMWWDNEFKLAKLYGFGHIEWIYDDNPNNLLNTSDGQKEISQYINKTLVNVQSICADYFIKYPFWDMACANKNIKTLNMLIVQAYKLGARTIVIPLVENSSMATNFAKQKDFTRNMRICLDVAGRYMMNIALESDMEPEKLKHLVANFESDRIGICHDTGNVMEIGFDESHSFAIYYPFVKHIHLKDKIKGQSPNLEIGTGNVSFRNLFHDMENVKYDGTVTLQCARKEYDLEYIKKQFNKIKQEYSFRDSGRLVHG